MAQNGSKPKNIALIPVTEWQKEQVRIDKTTLGDIKTASFEFGEVKIGDSIWHKFIVKNTGKDNLILSDAIASCDCTIASFTKEPIKPHKKGFVMGAFRVQDEGKNMHTLTVFNNTPATFDLLEMKFIGVKAVNNKQ
jgi:hypothetical protein